LRQIVQLAIESMVVNWGKSIGRNCVDGSNRSNSNTAAGLIPFSWTYEKLLYGCMTLSNPSKPNVRSDTLSHERDSLNEASTPASTTVRTPLPALITGLVGVGSSGIKLGINGSSMLA